MNYPSVYTTLSTEEMTYLTGGTALDAFNYLLGDWLRDKVLSDLRNTLWNSMKDVSVEPVKTTGKKIFGWGFPAQIAYGYGVFRLFETVKKYWEK